MVKRLISANNSEVLQMNKDQLIKSIQASEGRVIMSENIASGPANIAGLTNAELASSFGADLILLNTVDLLQPEIYGLTSEENKKLVKTLHRFTGKPIGVNLEPVDKYSKMNDYRVHISKGRVASQETFQIANQLQFDFICLTGNPGTGVSNQALVDSVKNAKASFNGLVVAGKMHGAGVKEPVIDKDTIVQLVENKVDILMIPAVGTIPGIDEDFVSKVVDYCHTHQVLVMTAIGTSQEGANQEVIQKIALTSKKLGVDLQHIGDGGESWLTPLENIYHMSLAIRGKRHTFSRIGRSVNR